MTPHKIPHRRPRRMRAVILVALTLALSVGLALIFEFGELASAPEVEAATNEPPLPTPSTSPDQGLTPAPDAAPGDESSADDGPARSAPLPPWQSLTRDDFWQIDRELADPSVLYAPESGYHAYGTSARQCIGDVCPDHWVPHFSGVSLAGPATLRGDAMPDRPAWVKANDRAIWAPSVARIGNAYVMYFAATSGRPEDSGSKCIGLATAVTPAGPFLPEPAPARCSRAYWNIDPYLVSDGTAWFLLWREDDATHPTGKIVAAPLSPSGRTFAGAEPTTLVKGRHAWEEGYPDGPRDAEGADGAERALAAPSTTTTGAAGGAAIGARQQLSPQAQQNAAGIGPVENPAMAWHPETGEWLLTWSANRWETQDYATGLAVCQGPVGPCERVSLDAPWLRSSGDPAISTGASFGGAGGLAFVTGPDNRLYAVFHAYPGSGHAPTSPRVAWAYRVDASNGYRLSEF